MNSSLLIESGIRLPFSVYQPSPGGERILPVTSAIALHRRSETGRGQRLGKLFSPDGKVGVGFRTVFEREKVVGRAAEKEREFDSSLEEGDDLGVYVALVEHLLFVTERRFFHSFDPNKPVYFEPKEQIRKEIATFEAIINRFRYSSGPLPKQLTARYCDYSAFLAQAISSTKAEWLLAKEILMFSLASVQWQRIRESEESLVAFVARRVLYDTASLEAAILTINKEILTALPRLNGTEERRALAQTYFKLAKLQHGELFLLG